MPGTEQALTAIISAPSAARIGLRAALGRWWRERRMATSLYALDDRILKDIGIRRCEIPSVARERAASLRET